MQTREWFAAHIADSEYDLVKSQSAFPDYTLEDKRGNRYLVEVEYKSENFIKHGHNSDGCDFVLCWIHDAKLDVPVHELSTGKRYDSEEVSEDIFDAGSASGSSTRNALRLQIQSIVTKIACSEFNDLKKCVNSDLEKRFDYDKGVALARLKLLGATKRLIDALRENGVEIDMNDLGPYDLYNLARGNGLIASVKMS